jgi:TolA-binding protein
MRPHLLMRRTPPCHTQLCGFLLSATFSALFVAEPARMSAQAAVPEAETGTADQQMERLADALTRTEAELAATQREIQALRAQLNELRQQLGVRGSASAAEDASSSGGQQDAIARRLQDVEERQSQQEAQIATHEQAKVESASKYPVRITGLILLNSFVNTRNVDDAATPAFAIQGSGSTGLALRQSVLGIDAQGPHLFGANTSADLRTDFSGAANSASYSSGLNLVRLRTAHANIAWKHTTAFFSLDRPILNPDTPTSLTAVAQPALAWSGNLWNWNQQFGVTHDVPFRKASALRLQAALIDPADPPAFSAGVVTTATTLPAPSAAERSRYPGGEARVAYVHNAAHPDATEIGVGGYFAPHRLTNGFRANSWAATLDYRIALPARLQWSGNVYRGQGLGGLGGGAYKDYMVRVQNGLLDVQFVDDVGGWTQLKQQVTERVEWNAAFGVDNDFAGQLRSYTLAPASSSYLSLARNRTYTANVIYSPSAYLLFSLEYRNIRSTPVMSPANQSNVIGAAAGYRF